MTQNHGHHSDDLTSVDLPMPRAAERSGTTSSADIRERSRSTLAGAFHTGRGRVGSALVLFVTATAVIGPFVAPHSPTELVSTAYAGPTWKAPFGSDGLGRDILSRLLCGGWELLVMAAIATAVGVLLGAAVGVAAAYYAGLSDSILMRTVDVVLAFPQLVFVLLLVSVVGPKPWLLVLAVALAHAPQVARVVRSVALDVTERDFVKSLELMAIRPWKVMTREILPNLSSTLMVEAGLRMTFSISIIAGLSFLGYGIEPPSPNWGVMIQENRIGLSASPLAVIAPVALLSLLTVGLNTFTDAIARVSLGVDLPVRRGLTGKPARRAAVEVSR